MYLPTDHKSAIRQDFAASLLLTPLFFSRFLVEFLGSNEEGMGSRAYIGGQSRSPEGGGLSPPGFARGWGPQSPEGGDRPPLPPRALGQGSLCKFEEKNYIKVLLPPTPTGDRGISSKFFETDIYF